MDMQNVSSIGNFLTDTHNVIMLNLQAAQCHACKSLEPIEAVEVVLRLQSVAAKVDRAFSSDLHQLDKLLTDW